MLAEDRWRWQMDQAARMRDSYEDGLEAGEKKAEARYQPVIGALKQKLRELGIDPWELAMAAKADPAIAEAAALFNPVTLKRDMDGARKRLLRHRRYRGIILAGK
jgi:hypothetical protein